MPERSVRDVIAERKPVTASGKTTVAAAAKAMKKHHVGAIMVVDGARLVGIFTERAMQSFACSPTVAIPIRRRCPQS